MTQFPERTRGTVLLVSLAMNQAAFFKAVGEHLAQAGYGTAHICFHERSHEWLTANGINSYNPFAWQPRDPGLVKLEAYQVPSLNLLLSHEKAAYEILDTARLTRKLQGHLHAVSAIIDDLKRAEPGLIHMVQELGGFLSVLAAYYAARAGGIDNWFIEPSFYRGRVFFTRNSFAAPVIEDPAQEVVMPEVAAYLDKTIRQQSVVIPAKDRHHYRGAVAKVTDRHNFARLGEKAWDKYVLGKREEFEHVGGHVSRHLRMFANSIRLRRRYRRLAEAGAFIYYPLHVPADFALTIRSPEYFDQYALVDYLCRVVPHTHRVAIKEHPALVGAASYERLTGLLRQHDNLVLLEPSTNNFNVIRQSSAIVTVNSKSGAEALLLGRPVIVLGDAFYRHCHLAIALERLTDLPQALEAVLAGSGEPPNEANIRPYFQEIWGRSWAGELYELSTGNVQVFASSLCNALAGDQSREQIPRRPPVRN